MKQKRFLLYIPLFLISTFGFAQTIDINAPMPIDPAIKKGVLKNGLTYYIKQNKQPEKRLELRLAVNAGSILENESQKGLAHFTEHMCFNGTKAFEKQALVNFLEKMGIEFGAELNAYTSFDETVYMLSVPADRIGLVDTAVMVLSEWAQNVSFDNTEIDKERGVVISEWRLGLGAQDRMRKQYWPVLLKNSRYADRMPIGTKEILETFPYDTLKQFYKDWYRPNLMAVSIVGDVNSDTLEALIKKHFDKAVNPTKQRTRSEFDIPDNTQPLVKVVTDKEFPYSIVQLYCKVPHKTQNNIGDYKNVILSSLFNGMINSRFEEIMKKSDAPFTYAGSEYSEFLGRSKDAYSAMAVAKENKILESLEKLVAVNNQIKQFGFTQGELDRQKKEIMSFYEKAVREKGKTESKSYVEEYIRNFLENEPIPGIDKEFLYVKQMMPTITVTELNMLAQQWIKDQNPTIIVMLPENSKIKIPTESEILNTYDQALQKKSQSYVDSYVDKPLISKTPKACKIVSRTENKEFGYTEIVLSNGAKVVLKPNNWKNDEILYLALSPGGQSLCDDKDIFSARATSDLINTSGVGGFDEINLEKKLSGNTASIHTFISNENEGFRGKVSPKDFETLMKLNYLYFTAPRIDSASYVTYINEKINDLKFQSTNPKFLFSDSLYKALYSNNKRYILMTDTNNFHAISVPNALAFYKQRFSNASDFTFLFVGNFKVDSLLPFLQTWIGSLPSSNMSKEQPKYLQPAFPKGTTNVTVKKGIEPQATVYWQSNTPLVWDRKALLDLDFLVEILGIKLRESMREEQGRVYGVRAKQSVQKKPKPECAIKISFGCAPEAIDTLLITIKNEMQNLIKNGPESIDVEKIREIKIRSLEQTVKTNNYWLSSLETKYSGDFDIESYDIAIQRIKSVTSDDIKKAAALYLNSNDVFKAVLIPEK